MKKRCLVLIPTYNCATQVCEVLEGIQQSCYGDITEILVVDNGSQDGTVDNVLLFRDKNNLSKLTVAKNERNYGLGGTHKLGIRYALKGKFDYLIVLHGDNQADPREIPLLMDKALSETRLDAVLGARFTKGSLLVGYSVLRTIGNRFFDLLFSIVTKRPVKDLGSGLNLFKVQSLAALDYQSYSDHCDFNVYLLLGLIEAKFNVVYIPISWREEDQKSNINPFVLGMHVLKILIAWKVKLPKPSPACFGKRRFQVLGRQTT